ncbi:tyrosinase family protein [Tautonia sp. JC769]|uniref:tyrosinase family protein n=1 Tax=Tautonia sp. JC769 TaxID=3232135 RepID=UPI0034582C8C
MNWQPSRRRFVQAGLVAGASAVLGSRHGRAGLTPRHANDLRIRKSALELPADDPVFAQYAEAVKRMHQLPETDARNWIRQAKIHADHCVHGGLDFCPWHRHYLNQFEQICGELIGDPSFALPYWDWSFERGKIPDPFFDVDALNVVFWDDPGVYSPPNWPNINSRPIRAIGKGFGVQDDPVRGGAFISSRINQILRQTDFRRFSLQLEGTPHNSGHVVVGFPAQGRPGHIGSGLSPLDPLFWLHHCNVDRLWAQWQLAGNTTPTFDSEFNGQFVDRDGQPIDVRAQDSIDFEALGYSYQQFQDPREFLDLAGIANFEDNQQPLLAALRLGGVEDQPRRVLGAVQPAEAVEIGVPNTFPVPVENLLAALNETGPVRDVSLPNLAAMMMRDGRPEADELAQFGREIPARRRILCALKGITSSFAIPPLVNVFVNCPYLSPSTPFTDIHYADTFSFFQVFEHEGGHDHHADGQNFLVDLTDAVEKVGLANLDQIRVQLMPVTAADQENPGSFSVDSIEIFSA